MNRRLRYSILVVDLIWIVISLAIAYVLRYGLLSPRAAGQPGYLQYCFVATLALGVWTMLHCVMPLDGFSAGWNVPSILSQMLTGVLLLMSIMLSTAFLARQFYSRLVLSYFGCLVLFGLVGVRLVIRFLIASRSRNGAQRRVVILGSDRIARELAAKISRHPELMKTVVGFLYGPNDVPVGSPQPDIPAAATAPINTLGIIELLKQQRVQEIIVAHPRANTSEIQKLIRSSRVAGLRVSLVPQGYELYASRTTFWDVGGVPMLTLEERRPSSIFIALKRVADITFAGLLMLLVSPILIVSAAAIIVSGEKPFRRELRCGLNGKVFSMWRINIRRDAPDLIGLGRWLAQLSLSELPQLWNVLRGDMSLVGPRPESVERVQRYSDWQAQRLRVKPGLTGLAQVYGLREQHASEDKARFDLQYILCWSPFLDLSLLVQTLWTVAIRVWNSSEKRPESQPEPTGILTEVIDADRSHAGAD